MSDVERSGQALFPTSTFVKASADESLEHSECDSEANADAGSSQRQVPLIPPFSRGEKLV